jgi:hypothetical protein
MHDLAAALLATGNFQTLAANIKNRRDISRGIPSCGEEIPDWRRPLIFQGRPMSLLGYNPSRGPSGES